jgi:hypothetical protein
VTNFQSEFSNIRPCPDLVDAFLDGNDFSSCISASQFTRQIERMYLLDKNFEHPRQKIDVIPPAGHGMFDGQLPEGTVSPEYE